MEKKAISEKEAAQRYPYSVAWFQRARWAGDGPPYWKIKGRVMYPVDELDAWFSSEGLRNSTSEIKKKPTTE